ncbi:ABC transporter substrate-binding protein [Henriciella sp. AS95]|uniref:ABC transporter substrate-binding protein n=1 Tax=Henriciella sp. AS95 TaxID=3135782 RepID=UPI00316E8E54
MRLVCALLAALVLARPEMAEAEKPTVVSLDYCADQFVMGLADREQILGVSPHAGRSFSHLRDKADGLPRVRALAEDVIALQPDIVVRSWGGDARALDFFQRFGIETVQIGYASDFEGAARVTREIAEKLDQQDRAEDLVTSLNFAAPQTGETALYLTPGGVTAGPGTMVDQIMTAAGLENAVSQQGWVNVPLETLVQNPPQRVLAAFFDFDEDRASNWSLTRHPAMQRILANAKTIRLDESRLTCPAWFVADEARAVAEALN